MALKGNRWRQYRYHREEEARRDLLPREYSL